MSRGRICFATIEYPPDIGGVARAAARIVHGLAAANYEMHVFRRSYDLSSSHGSIEDLKKSMITIHQISRSDVLGSDAIERIDRRLKFDLFHGFFLPSAFVCLQAASKRNRPVVASIRGIDGTRLESPIASIVLKRARWITSVSRDSLRRAAECVDISAKSSFIPNSVEVPTTPQWTLTQANRGTVGTITTFRRKKNIPLLIGAYGSLSPLLRKRLTLIGKLEGAQPGSHIQLEQLRIIRCIQSLNLLAEVDVKGYITHNMVGEELLKLHVFVVSSDHEGMPNAILEAAATGIPIVATAVDGIRDIFKSGDNCLLVEPGDQWGISAAISRIMRDDHLARRLGRGAFELARQHSSKRELLSYANLYSHLIATEQSLNRVEKY